MAHDLRCHSQESSSLSSCQWGLVLFQRCRCTWAVRRWELKQVHPACFCFPTTQPVPPAFAALRDGWAHAYPGIVVPGVEWHCHQLWCSCAGLGAQGCCAVTDVFATTAGRAPAVLHWCSVWVTGVKNIKTTTQKPVVCSKEWEAGSSFNNVSRNGDEWQSSRSEVLVLVWLRRRCSAVVSGVRLLPHWQMKCPQKQTSCISMVAGWSECCTLRFEMKFQLVAVLTSRRWWLWTWHTVQSPSCSSWSLLRACQEVPFSLSERGGIRNIRNCFIRTILLLWDWGTLRLVLLKCSCFIRTVGAAVFSWAFLKGVMKKNQNKIMSQQLWIWWMS